MRRAAAALVAAVALVAPGRAGTAPEGSAGALFEGAEISVPSEGRSRLRVEGITGRIDISAGGEGEIFVRSELGGRKPKPLPVEVRAVGRDVLVRPLAKGRDAPRRIEIRVPATFAVDLRARDSRVVARGIAGGFDARGGNLRIEASGLDGPLGADLAGGSLTATALGDRVTVTGEEATIGITGAVGDVDVRLLGASHVQLASLGGALNVDLERGSLIVRGLAGAASVRQRGGTARVEEMAVGGQLFFRDTSAAVARSRGQIVVDADGDLRLEDLDASVRVLLSGGTLVGAGLRAGLDVRAIGPASVSVEGVSGAVQAEGQDVAVSVREAHSAVEIRTSGAPVEVDGASALVRVENDGGEVVGRRLTGAVGVVSRGGDVRLETLSCPVRVQAEGRQVRVAWISNPSLEDSTIRNDGGGVEVEFGHAGGCRVEAESSEGSIESRIRGVAVEGGASARGLVGARGERLVRIVARGDIRLSGGPPE